MVIQRIFIVGLFLAQAVVAIEVSSGPVRRGEWNRDFPAALDLACKEHCPLLLVHSSIGCTICNRLKNAMEGAAFRLWQKDRNVAMAYVSTHGEGSEEYRRVRGFIKTVNSEVSGFPYVCVYWPKADGSTNSVAFSGRRGNMGDENAKLLSVALMTELDEALKEYIASRVESKTINQIVAASTRKVGYKIEGALGSVSMRPDTGILPEGGKVTLEAAAADGTLFMGWLDPNGNVVSYKKRIGVSGGMLAGEYIARFRTKVGCPPPDVKPAITSICVTAGMPFRYQTPVADECRPVRFGIKRRLFSQVKFDEVDGVLYGTLKRAGSYAIDITVIGSDPGRTVVKHSVRIDVKAK